MPKRHKYTVRVEVLLTYDIEIAADDPAMAESEALALDVDSLSESGTLVSEEVQSAMVVEDEDSDEDDGFVPYPVD